MKYIEAIGKRFNKLTVLSLTKHYNKKYYFLCSCDCGNKTEVQFSHLKTGVTKSCGCLRKGGKAKKSNTKYTAPLVWELNGIKCKGSNPFKACTTAAKNTALKRRIAFSITDEDVKNLFIQQSGKCYYTGLLMSFITDSPYKMSIDRKDSSKPYEHSNIVLCCKSINLFKNTLSEEAFFSVLFKLKNG